MNTEIPATVIEGLKKFVCLMALTGMVSCSGSSAPTTALSADVKNAVGPDSIAASLEIVPSPAPATKNSKLAAIPKGFAFGPAKVEWFVNKEPAPNASGIFFDASNTKRGDEVEARVIVGGAQLRSNIVKIGNTVPELSRLKIMPEVFKKGDRLYVEAVGSDADGDNVSILYEWTVNGVAAGKEKTIGAAIRRGDKVAVTITPYDGQDYGLATTLTREIRNMPPSFSEDHKSSFDGSVFTCRLNAEDPDGDTLAYSLKSAPEGMTINPNTGLVTWNVPPEYNGRTPFIAVVKDGSGGEATCNLYVEISPEKRK